MSHRHNPELKLYFVDLSYDSVESFELGEGIVSENFKNTLEKKHGQNFQSANICAGADFPSFVTTLTDLMSNWWVIAVGAFLMGKIIRENLKAWADIGSALRKFTTERLYPNREAAATFALGQLLKDGNGIPTELQLIGYKFIPHYELSRCANSNCEAIDQIEDAPPQYRLGEGAHAFDIRKDEKTYRVIVHGTKIELKEIR